jgi:hypothetical protein
VTIVTILEFRLTIAPTAVPERKIAIAVMKKGEKSERSLTPWAIPSITAAMAAGQARNEKNLRTM